MQGKINLVMNVNQLQAIFTRMGVVPKEIQRASLYLSFLQQAQTYFTKTLAAATNASPPGLGNDYPFVKPALQSPKLLQQLADIFDLLIVPAVDGAMRALNQKPAIAYNTYFSTYIFNANDTTWASNVATFFNNVPITNAVLGSVTNNFMKNVAQACRRIIEDQQVLTQVFFSDLTAPAITSLQQIESSGSDFHNGGKQVLFLTFAVTSYIAHPQDVMPVTQQRKVVYKPSDLEADCLLVGNSAAANAAVPNFNLQQSLVEIFNAAAQNNAALQIEPLPTYRVLPRNPMSLSGVAAAPFPVGNGYGYIEYLDHGHTDARKFWGFTYAAAWSDYIILSENQVAPTSEKFYRMMGHWLALACTFSFVDVHMENIRVHKYLPYLIDMELSLTGTVNDVAATQLFDNSNGGINVSVRQTARFEWGPAPAFKRDYKDDVGKNRLYYPDNTHPVDVDYRAIARGFNDAITVLGAAQAAGQFNTFLGRTTNVLVRYLCGATSAYQSTRDLIFLQAPADTSKRGNALLDTVKAQMLVSLSVGYNAYQAGAVPDYLSFATNNTMLELYNFDIPVFYTRIGSLDVLDTSGKPVPIPAQVTVYNNATPPVPTQMPTNVGRATFFPAVPTTVNVVQNQLAVLANGNTRNTRAQALRDSFSAFLDANRINVPNLFN